MTAQPVLRDPPSAAATDSRLGALGVWLSGRLPDLAGPIQLERIQGGQSNPSWILRAGARHWVLRARPGPAADLLPSAHAIDREFRVMRALADSGVPVPAVRLLCEDESVFGAAFYVMDFVPGRVFRDPALPGVGAAQRADFWREAVRVLARLHAAPWDALGLADFGRQGGFFVRQARRWTAQYRASQAGTERLPAMERLADWLPAHLPPVLEQPGASTLTHGDYRLENLMFDLRAPRVAAVLDWELSTLGHPLSDLAYFCGAWHLPGGLLRGFGAGGAAALGLPTEAEIVRLYCAETGCPLDEVEAHWAYLQAANLFRLGAILAGVGARARQGQAAHPQAQALAAMAAPVAELGWAYASGRRGGVQD